MLPITRWTVQTETRPDGSILVEPNHALGPYPNRMTDSLDHWAAAAPDRTFLAQRAADGEWQRLSYADFRRRARSVAQWLLRQDLSAERPIAILSGNDLDHAVLGMAAMYAGIPYAPVSPPYALVSKDFAKLRHVFDLLTPGLVFVSDGQAFSRAIDAVVPAKCRILVGKNPPPDRRAVLIAGLFNEADSALPEVHTDRIAKILFTSGSTGIPKGVITTHRMLTSNQEMLRTVFPFLRDEPLVICDWLPWNHTFGGSHNFGLVLYNGGTFYLDKGKPVPGAFDETLRNLREIAPTAYFNVPKAYEMLVEHLRRDKGLREKFYSRLRMTFYAAAGLSQHVWDALDELATQTRGERVPMLTGLGATESAPFALCADGENSGAGRIGLPVPGVRLKLVAGAKLEVRVKGPNITPGYWRQPDLTRAAFDDEGYYCFGDAVRFLDETNPNAGFVFDGRIAEDFKLATGTWVSVGPLRTRMILHFAPYLRDVVIAGHDRDEVTALLFPDPDHYARLQREGTARETLAALLGTFAATSTGSSNRVERALVLDEPPSLDAGELTDKGSVNPWAVLRHRADQVEMLYCRSDARTTLRPAILCSSKRGYSGI